jgi:hypothetical protein
MDMCFLVSTACMREKNIHKNKGKRRKFGLDSKQRYLQE